MTKLLLKRVLVVKLLMISLLFNGEILFAQTVKKATAQMDSNDSDHKKKTYLILISGDGFRYDYAEKYNAKNLLQLSSGGVKAKFMIPSFPSVTHPNHYTLITGLYPGHTGIAGNSFYDSGTKKAYQKSEQSWFNAESIWHTADKAHMLTANINWVNGKTISKKIERVYQLKKTGEVGTEDKVSAIQNWLGMDEKERPHLITLYFNNTDHAGHEFGPDSPETAQAVKEIDDAVGQIVEAVKETKLPVNFIFVSDHGMIKINKADRLKIPVAIDTSKFIINNQNSLINFYAKDSSAISKTYQALKANEVGYKVYLNKDFPSNLHYGGMDDRYHHAGDLILVSLWPNTFNPKSGMGMHGFNPEVNKEMSATFMAWGPAFKTGVVIESFENVEVYQLMTTLLGLKPAKNDGKGKLAGQVLK